MRSAAPASSAMYSGFSYRMSMTAVPISIRLVRAPTAASSGNGDPSCLAKWCTRKYAPSAPSSSAATARSIDCSNASDADRVCEPGDDDQCPNDRKPIFFTSASTRAAQAAFLPVEPPGSRRDHGRAGLSPCPGRDLPGQLDGLLRTSLPGKTVTGQDPASVDRLDLFQRGQGLV